MNGIHDMGGMHGMGPIVHEEHEPVFHHEWERRAFAITMAAGFLGEWNIDMSRYVRERMPAAEYLAASYYERWLWGLERLLLECGLLTRQEIESGRARGRIPNVRCSCCVAPPAPPGKRSVYQAPRALVAPAPRRVGRPRVSGPVSCSAEEFVHREEEIGEGLRGEGLAAREPLDPAIAPLARLLIDFDTFRGEIHDPDLGDPGARVEGYLDRSIVVE